MPLTLGVKSLRDVKATEFQLIRGQGKATLVLYEVLPFC